MMIGPFDEISIAPLKLRPIIEAKRLLIVQAKARSPLHDMSNVAGHIVK